ncbi:MAG: fibronectin type III domain-containing protein [Lachnospiraceae bacterium]|nr:fibronectin type III domain-containing protein [Lachnospiraceae bacterium]
MWKKTADNLLMLLLCLCSMFLFQSGKVNAAMTEEAENYEVGEIYEGRIIDQGDKRYFRFTVSEKSHVTLYLTCRKGICKGRIFDELGKEAMRGEDLIFDRNIFAGRSSAQLSRTFPSGTYYLELGNEGKWKWQECRFSFRIQAEKEIKLSKGILRSLDSFEAGQLTVKCEPEENAIGYRIQYSMDEQLQKDVKTMDSSETVNTIKNLKKGQRYYVKVCPYTVYDDGTYVYGESSYVKSAVIDRK